MSNKTSIVIFGGIMIVCLRAKNCDMQGVFLYFKEDLFLNKEGDYGINGEDY